MARTGSTRSRKTTPATESAPEAVPAESASKADPTEAIKEATVSVDTVESTSVNNSVIEPTESTESTESTKSDEASTKPVEASSASEAAKPEFDLADFNAVVETALGNVNQSTGKVDPANIEAFQGAYRNLEGVKPRNAAKRSLNDRLRSAVLAADTIGAQAIMDLIDAVSSAGSAAKAPTEKTPVDPTEAFVQRLTLHNLAYNLVLGDVPDGVDAESAQQSAAQKVGELSDQADSYLAWTKAPEDSRGEEPEVNPLVKKAVRIAQGKVSASRSGGGGTSATHEGPRGNVARHIQLAFRDQPIGAELRVAEIVKVKTEEYPDRAPSAGAVNARLKSNNPIEGVETCLVDGKAGARKTANVQL